MSATSTAGPAGPTQPVGRVRAFLRLVAIEHSVFALPFAYLSALTVMARLGGGVRWLDLLLITVAMVGARTFAMAANRIIDRHIDARNPRTAGRELVTGAVSVRTAWTGAAVALVVFLGAAAALNPLCLMLAPLAVVPLVVYPYAKRFTDWPHAVLGLAQMIGPVGAWLAVTGTFDGAGPALLLGAAVGGLIVLTNSRTLLRALGVPDAARYGVYLAVIVAWVAAFWLAVRVLRRTNRAAAATPATPATPAHDPDDLALIDGQK